MHFCEKECVLCKLVAFPQFSCENVRIFKEMLENECNSKDITRLGNFWCTCLTDLKHHVNVDISVTEGNICESLITFYLSINIKLNCHTTRLS